MQKARRTSKKRHSILFWIMGIILAFIVPFNILLIASMQNYMNTVQSQTQYSCASVLRLYLNQLQQEMDQTESYFYNLQRGDQYFIRASLAVQGDDEATLALHNLYREFQGQLILGRLPSAYFFCAKGLQDPIVATTGDDVTVQKTVTQWLFDREDWLQANAWENIEIDGARYLIRTYDDGNAYFGAVINLDSFLQNMAENLEYPYEKVGIAPKSESGMLSKQYEDALLVSEQLEDMKFSVYVVLGNEVVYQSLSALQKLIYIVSFASIGMVPILIYIFNRLLVKPIQQIDYALNELENGNRAYRIREGFRTTELDHMGHSYNDMVDQIEHLKIESYEKEIEKNKVQLRNIQLQVNPHFLLNIFHLIYSMAQTHNTSGVQKMTLYLSTYFREMLSDGDLHTVKREMELVEKYFEILDMQYPDCFEVIYEINDGCWNVQIPTLLIHNLVENIAKYALQVGSYVTVTIRCFQTRDGVVLEVEDDGQGIEPEILEMINQARSVVKKDGKHIGLSNSSRRLKILFSAQARLVVTSTPAEGTKVQVLIPREDVKYETVIGG